MLFRLPVWNELSHIEGQHWREHNNPEKVLMPSPVKKNKFNECIFCCNGSVKIK